MLTPSKKSSHINSSIILFGFLLISGCVSRTNSTTPSKPITPNIPPSRTLSPAPPNTPTHFPEATLLPPPTATPIVPDTGWIELRMGLHRRIINILDDEGDQFEHLYILKMSPEFFTFDVAYDPEGKTLEDWQTETKALIVLNGGYFRTENTKYIPNGLTIIEGNTIGISYADFGGMFVVSNEGPDLRCLSQKPYDPNEPLLAALQSFPILVKPGGVLGFPEEHEDHQQARRSVIGQTQNGDIVFMIASIGNLTLHQLSSYLVQSDFDLDIALNLDGGPSSGLVLSMPVEFVPSFMPLPVVITVFQR